MNQPTPDVATQLAALRDEFRHSLPERLAGLERELAALDGRWNETGLAALTGLHANAHRLAGAAGIFGMHALGKVAHDLEILTQQLIAHPERRDPAALALLHALSGSLASLAAKNPPPEEFDGNMTSSTELERGGEKSIFIVDDEPAVGRDLAEKLARHGYAASVFASPEAMLAALVDQTPAALVLDLMFPGGMIDLELVAQVRSVLKQPLPVLVISARGDLNARLEALRGGCNAYLTKPVAPEELQRVVIARIRRTLRLRSMMSRDSLTGLLNHARFIEQLGIELARAERNSQPLAVAMIDIDHFKQVNDGHGHATGDIVIKSLARLLQQRLRQVDVIGRYGGEEFAVVLPDTPLPAAITLLDEIRRTFGARRFMPSGAADTGEAFRVSFSAGVSALSAQSGAAAPRALVEAADRALYRAKHAGRDRIMGNPPETPQ